MIRIYPKEHLCIHAIDGTCEICGRVNSRVRRSFNTDDVISSQVEVNTKEWKGLVGSKGV